MKKKVAWNKDQTESVVLSKLKSFTIKDEAYKGQSHEAFVFCWAVRGWYNETNSFLFGMWNTEKEARDFLTEIHNSF